MLSFPCDNTLFYASVHQCPNELVSSCLFSKNVEIPYWGWMPFHVSQRNRGGEDRAPVTYSMALSSRLTGDKHAFRIRRCTLSVNSLAHQINRFVRGLFRSQSLKLQDILAWFSCNLVHLSHSPTFCSIFAGQQSTVTQTYMPRLDCTFLCQALSIENRFFCQRTHALIFRFYIWFFL